jgi:hypothetical protein
MRGDLTENTKSGKSKYAILKRMGHALMKRALNYLYVEDQAFSPSYNWAPPHPLSPPPPSGSKLDRRHIGRLREKEKLLADRKRGRGGGGAKLYDSEKALSSINHLILSGLEPKRA